MEGTGPQLRALRAACFAALCVTLSATAHILLSREPLPLATTAGAAVGVFGVAYALCGRERGYWPIAGLLVPLELAVDTLYTAGQHTCYGPAGGPVTGSWRSINEALACHGGDVGGPLAGAAGGPGHSASPWLLLVVHVAVGLTAAWWLRRGEAALHGLLRTVFRPLLVAVAALRGTARPRTAARRSVPAAAAAPALPLLLHTVVRRGPPVVAAAR
ncbi:hypothetical protein ACFWVC_16030 [Streptomyces sp. NPDC058691]|uniref:hypothetical protein n=1 Tax=Streptomyces sp. NPDC058691 TaxID=3346601 RepID=UPI00365DC593